MSLKYTRVRTVHNDSFMLQFVSILCSGHISCLRCKITFSPPWITYLCPTVSIPVLTFPSLYCFYVYIKWYMKQQVRDGRLWIFRRLIPSMFKINTYFVITVIKRKTHITKFNITVTAYSLRNFLIFLKLDIQNFKVYIVGTAVVFVSLMIGN